MQQQQSEKFFPLYRDDPIYGSAWCSNKCIIEQGDQRFFTRVRYRFPGEAGYRYQGFYQSSGYNTKQRGVWFPFDGIVVVDEASKPKTQRLMKNWIAKVVYTNSVKHLKKSVLAKRFGCPLFVFISKHMENVHPVQRQTPFWNDITKFSNLMKELKAPHPRHTGDESKMKQKQLHVLHCVHAPAEIDYGIMVNRMIKNAVSVNWLYDIPSDISKYPDEYDKDLKDLVALNPLDLDSILDGSEILLPGRFKFTLKPVLIGTDGMLYIPDFIVSSRPVITWLTLHQYMQDLVSRNSWQPLQAFQQQQQQQQQKKPAAAAAAAEPKKRKIQQAPAQTRRSQRLRKKQGGK